VTIHRSALLALLLSVLAPAASRAVDVPLPPPPPGTNLQASTGGYKVALLGGFLGQGDVASASLQLDVARRADFPQLKRIAVEWHLPIRVARPQWDGALTRTIVVPIAYGGGAIQETVGTTKDTNWIFEGIPSARAILPIVPGFAIHAEVGIGLAVTAETHVEEEFHVGHTTTRKLVVAPSVSAAFGLTYQIGDRLDVVFQPLVFGRRAKADASTFSALWGLSYRL
jgi:hypothetical protein